MNVKLQNVSLLRIALLAIVCLFSATAYADDLRRVKAEKVGMSSTRLERLEELNQRYVDEGKLAGVMTMVARDGKIAHVSAAGTYGVDNDKPLTEDTLFRIYSMTKPITAVALMMLYEEGAFQLSDPVSKFLRQFENMQVWKQDHYEDAQGPITMHQLLTHTAGLTYGYPGASPVDDRYQEADLLGAKDLEEFIDRLAEIPLLFEPGERWHYGVSYDVLGAVVEKISGQAYGDFLETRIFGPLGMDDTFFQVPVDELDRFPTNHRWSMEEQELVPIDEQEPLNRSFTTDAFAAGGHGLVSTIGDYMKFCEMLRNGGTFNGSRILSPKTLQYMMRNHLSATSSAASSRDERGTHRQGVLRGTSFGIGFGIVVDPAQAEVISSPGTYFWGGHAGTIFWIDPEEDLVAIAMMQLMASPWPFRNEMGVMTYQAIDELNGGQ